MLAIVEFGEATSYREPAQSGFVLVGVPIATEQLWKVFHNCSIATHGPAPLQSDPRPPSRLSTGSGTSSGSYPYPVICPVTARGARKCKVGTP